MSCKHGNWAPCDECAEEDALFDSAYKSGYEAGGKVSIDLTMKHLRRAEAAESLNKRLVELLRNPSPELLKNCGRRLLRFQDDSTDESFSALQWAEVKQDAARVLAELSAELLKEVGK